MCEMPWRCPVCKNERMVDFDKLEQRPVGRTMNSVGYNCSCGNFVIIGYMTDSISDALSKLQRYKPTKTQYQYRLRRLVHKAISLNEKMV